jgi:prophage DNA circulation protein
MAWNDRLREAAYTSPDGTRVTFDYENVRKTIDKKTTGFEFPDADGTFVQDLGHSGRRYPLRVFFWGDNYDLEADVFEALLLERGTGKLEHPIYGVIDVVPFGTISRRDDLKTAANQAIIEVTFWETIGLIYPTSQNDPASDVLAAVNAYNLAAAEMFDETTSLDSAVEQATLKSSYTALLDSVSAGLQGVADTQDNVRKQFDAIVDSVNLGIDILIDQPLTLASQTTQLIQAPARALTSIQARLDSYRNLAAIIISGGVTSQGLDSSNSNTFHTKDLYASTYVTGSIVSVINNQFNTKTEALEAAEDILAQLDDVVNWRDDNYQSLGEVDTGEAYQQLQDAAALTAGFLVSISFSLKQERTLVLDRARTIVDLVGELYGSVDDQLDFFINSNDLIGSEILELPRGRSIVYFV